MSNNIDNPVMEFRTETPSGSNTLVAFELPTSGSTANLLIQGVKL